MYSTYTMHSTPAMLQSCSFQVCVLLIQLKGHNMMYHSSNSHVASRDTILQVKEFTKHVQWACVSGLLHLRAHETMRP